MNIKDIEEAAQILLLGELHNTLLVLEDNPSNVKALDYSDKLVLALCNDKSTTAH